MRQDDIVLIVGQKKDFWQLAPPKTLHCYIPSACVSPGNSLLKSVQVFPKPSADGPVLATLQKGEPVSVLPSKQEAGWCEISPPSCLSCYARKDAVVYCDTADQFSLLVESREKAESDLLQAYRGLERVLKEPQITPLAEKVSLFFHDFLREYAPFPFLQNRAREGLYFLEEHKKKWASSRMEKERNFSLQTGSLEKVAVSPLQPKGVDPWRQVEEGLFSIWQTSHPHKSLQEYYAEQTLQGVTAEGMIEAYEMRVTNCPGDFLLRKNQRPVALLYSTKWDLTKYQGKQVRLLLAPRPNHQWAFPAYFVLEVD
ncbi:MAG: SH3 domain-containing protein [Chlamydiota bacterium]